MKVRIFLLGALACLAFSFMHSENSSEEPASYVHIINNGQVDLLINDVLIPVHVGKAKLYPVQAIDKKLVIQIPDKDPDFAHTVKLLDCDMGATIKIGGFYDTNNDRYFVSVLRSDKVPILFAIKKKFGQGILQKL